MKRAIIVPAELAGAALDDLKAWLAIGTTREDMALTGLLRAALEMCEGFTGRMPLAAECEELLPGTTCWQSLRTRPVQAITQVEALAATGEREPLDIADHAMELDEDGGARLRLTGQRQVARIAVRFTAGLAPDWASLPDGLRHGVLRLAAHHYREREGPGAVPLPPAAVAALWRPWRRMRLA